ncbi:hypothetical protein H4Q26_003227 [Puccinia striiformis f. sp. tritici PST-130]|uniref:Ubiquitin-like domain-containing protein n=1 Tax=Puccinia striiformis f. sp. tritici PST-78 TaxID=1165861 RepID=A0A0L0VIL7_9BASI|nr:hypothetical protein H4Q26_003227 [Puccinia striiformis f. sp. tritici PST-130]KNE99130.1 hypothetical protein PSTG_07609 [Puccinia striiformis f. sp. tritici PST-78]
MSNSPPPQADQDVKPDKAAGKITLKILPTSQTHETVISLFQCNSTHPINHSSILNRILKHRLHIVSNGDEPLMLRVKTTTTFAKIYNAVAKQKNVAITSFRLQCDDQRLIPNETTPADLNLDDEEVLDYFVEQLGG